MKVFNSNDQTITIDFTPNELIGISSCIAAVVEYYEEIDEAILNLSKSDLLSLKEKYFDTISNFFVDEKE